jgi:hypothetical protein
MSALGHKRTCAVQTDISDLPPIADMCGAKRDVRFVPIADIVNAGLMGYPCGATTGGAQSLLDFSSVWSKELSCSPTGRRAKKNARARNAALDRKEDCND